MSFSEAEKKGLISIKGVGETVVTRLEQIGIHSLDQLKECDVEFITGSVSAMLGSTCWSNSPMAKSAINNAIQYAKENSQN